jgi:Protein of unknown function (DUF3455)
LDATKAAADKKPWWPILSSAVADERMGLASYFNSGHLGVKLWRTMQRLLLITTLIATATLAFGQGLARPDVPDKIKAPAGEDVILLAHATGSQIYVCQPGTEGKFAWALKGPEAELHDQQGATIGRHYAGPTWKDNDGSEVTGKAVARVDSPDADSIPWLLVTVTSHSGDGVLSHVTSIQRIHTKAGLPPPASECNAAKQNAEVKSSYSADYYFYAPAM